MMTAKIAADKFNNGRPTIRVGVFVPGDSQLLDAACIDIIASMSWQYMELVQQLVPKAVSDLAPNVDICYIGSVGAGEPIPYTANQQILATHHYSDPEVAPGTLDVVLVPGPNPFADFNEGGVRWLREHGERKDKTDILSVCTGIFLCGEAGLLKGRRASGPRGMQSEIQKRGYGEKELVGSKWRWVQDGNFWSSGGVTNGNDLVAAYCRANPKRFPRPLVDLTCDLLDVGDRPQQYGASQTGFLMGIAWHVLRSWLAGFGRKSQKVE